MRARDDGLSLVELTIAMGLMVAVTAGVFGVLTPAQGVSVTQPEAADMQQRLRVATDTLFRDLLVAGAGPYAGSRAGALLYAFAPVLPLRHDQSGGDPPGTFATDTITLISVPTTAAQTTLAADLAPGALTLQLAREPGCAVGVNLCSFTAGMTLLVYNDTGSFDTFTVAAVADASAQVQLASRPRDSSAMTFKAGSPVVEAQVHVYSLKIDPLTQTAQLMHSDGSTNTDVPVVDHIVGLTFEYYGEPEPPSLTRPLSDPTGPWTTYGPKPPPLDATTTAYPAGENCAFQVDGGSGLQVPRLAALSAHLALVQLNPEQLTDGPWCPDQFSGNRWDADLLRIRSVVVTVRVEAALAALRGPAGPLFTNGGSSRTANRWAPDLERHVAVFPRNLNLRR